MFSATHEKAMTRDQEILVASQQINLQHSKMTHDLQVRVPSDPHAPIDNAVHIERARSVDSSAGSAMQ